MGKLTISMVIFNSYVKLPEGRNGDIIWIIKLKRWCCNLMLQPDCDITGTMLLKENHPSWDLISCWWSIWIYPKTFEQGGWSIMTGWILWSFNGEKLLRNWTGPMLPEWFALGSLLLQYLFGWCGVNPPNMQWCSIFGLIFTTHFQHHP